MLETNSGSQGPDVRDIWCTVDNKGGIQGERGANRAVSR